jgi:hypothetical protein
MRVSLFGVRVLVVAVGVSAVGVSVSVVVKEEQTDNVGSQTE